LPIVYIVLVSHNVMLLQRSGYIQSLSLSLHFIALRYNKTQ